MKIGSNITPFFLLSCSACLVVSSLTPTQGAILNFDAEITRNFSDVLETLEYSAVVPDFVSPTVLGAERSWTYPILALSSQVGGQTTNFHSSLLATSRLRVEFSSLSSYEIHLDNLPVPDIASLPELDNLVIMGATSYLDETSSPLQMLREDASDLALLEPVESGNLDVSVTPLYLFEPLPQGGSLFVVPKNASVVPESQSVLLGLMAVLLSVGRRQRKS